MSTDQQPAGNGIIKAAEGETWSHSAPDTPSLDPQSAKLISKSGSSQTNSENEPAKTCPESGSSGRTESPDLLGNEAKNALAKLESADTTSGSESPKTKPGTEPADTTSGSESPKAKPGSESADTTPGSESTKAKSGTKSADTTPGSESQEMKPGTESADTTPGSESPKAKSGTKSADTTPGSESPKMKPGSESLKAKPGSESADTTSGSESTKAKSGTKSADTTPGSESPKMKPGTESADTTPGSESPKAKSGTKSVDTTSGSESPKTKPGSESVDTTSGSESPIAKSGTESADTTSGSESLNAKPGTESPSTSDIPKTKLGSKSLGSESPNAKPGTESPDTKTWKKKTVALKTTDNMFTRGYKSLKNKVKGSILDMEHTRLCLDENSPPSIRLVHYNQHEKVFEVNQEAIQILRKITKPVAVLGICGPSRSGKSYFMSHVMKSEDFKVTNQMEACTKGIWMSSSVLDSKEYSVIVLDTEGSGDAQASDSSEEVVLKYLIITTLLTSYLIYNSQGVPSKSNLDQMSCFGELSQSVLISESHEKDDLHEHDLGQYFPDFLWLLRDCAFTLSKDWKGKEISTTDHIHRNILSLSTQEARSPPSKRDATVRNIKTVFQSIECLQIPPPCWSKSHPDPSQEFVSALDNAVQHVLSNIKVKHGFNKSTPLNGPMVAALLEQYVEAVNTPGSIPNLEVSYQNAVDNTLRNRIKELTSNYSRDMRRMLEDKTPMDQGDVSTIDISHSKLKEKALRGTLDKVSSVAKADTLFSVHENVYTSQLSILVAEVHKLIPLGTTKKQMRDNEQIHRKKQLLTEFESHISLTENEEVIGGLLYGFVHSNLTASRSTCQSCFESVYKEQTHNSLTQIKSEYYKQAKGPAKDEVFQSKYSRIPGPPVNVHEVSKTDETIKISWETPTINPNAAKHYKVVCYRKGDDFNQGRQSPELSREIYEIRELLPKTTYRLSVCGTNSNREGEFSKPINVTTEPGVPDIPDPPTIIPYTYCTGKLVVQLLPKSKQNGSPIKKFIIGRRSDITSDWKEHHYEVNPTQGDHQSLQIGLKCEPDDTILYFRVRLENEAGPSKPSKDFPLPVKDMIPGKPKDIRSHAKAREVQLTWNPPLSNQRAAKFYHVQRQETTHNKSSTWRDEVTNHTETTLVIHELTPKTKYSFRICANSVHHSSEYSIENVETLADKPEPPQKPMIYVHSPTDANLSFARQCHEKENGSAVTKVVIEKAKKTISATKDWEKEYHDLNEQVVVGDVHIPIRLYNLTEKFHTVYRIRTVNSVGESKPSPTCEISPSQMIPGRPEALTVCNKTSTSITVSWREPRINPKAVNIYKVQFKKVGETSWTTKQTDSQAPKGTKGLFTTNLTDLKTCTEYNIRVGAINENQTQSDLTELTVTTEPSVPPKPKTPRISPKEGRFSVKVQLPAIEESGREVTDLHVHHYNSSNTASPFLTHEFEIDTEEIIEQESGRFYEKTIEVNIDKTKWVSITLENKVGISKEESELVGVCSDDVVPGAPENLKCEPDVKQVDLTWDVPSKNGNAAKDYEVFFKLKADVDDSGWKQIRDCHPYQLKDPSLHYKTTIEKLRPNTAYCFKVQAVNTNSSKVHTGESAIVEANTTCSTPDMPSPPTVEVITDSIPLEANITWKLLIEEQMNGSPVTGIIIESKTVGDWSKVKMQPKATTGESLVPNFEEKGIHHCSLNTASPFQDFEIDNEKIIEEEGSCKTVESCSEVGVTEMPLKATTGKILIPSLKQNSIKAYLFRVIMKNSKGLSEPSDEFALRVSSLPPGKPEEVKTSHESAHSCKVTWQKPKFNDLLVNEYWIEYAVKGESILTSLVLPLEKAECEISGLKSNQSYDVKISAVGSIRGPSVKLEVKTSEIYPGKPNMLRLDKTGIKSLKIRWQRPDHNPLEVMYYSVYVREGNWKKQLENSKHGNQVPRALHVRHTKGHSAVFNNLDSSTTYTFSVTSYNDNKRRRPTSTIHEEFSTKMSILKRRALQGLVAVPTLGMGTVALQYKQTPSEDIVPSDDEYCDHDPKAFPSAPTNLNEVETGKNYITIQWNKPNFNKEELSTYYLEVRMGNWKMNLEDDTPQKNIPKPLQSRDIDPSNEPHKIKDLEENTTYTISLTSYNYFDKTNEEGAAAHIEVSTTNERSQATHRLRFQGWNDAFDT